MEEPCKSSPGHSISAILYFTHPYLSLSKLNPQAFISSPADHWSKTKESYFASTQKFDFQEFRENVCPIPHNISPILVSFAPTEKTPNARVRAESPTIPRTFRVSVKWSDPHIKFSVDHIPTFGHMQNTPSHWKPIPERTCHLQMNLPTEFSLSPGNIRLTVSSIVKNRTTHNGIHL